MQIAGRGPPGLLLPEWACLSPGHFPFQGPLGVLSFPWGSQWDCLARTAQSLARMRAWKA